MRYSNVVFDLDGTLVDSYRALTTAVNAARAAEGRGPIQVADVRAATGEGMELLLTRTWGGADYPQSYLERFEREYERVCVLETELLDDVLETIEELARLGTRMGVCTNKPTAFSEQILAQLEIGRHFSAVVGPDLAGVRKPDPAHVRFTMERIGGSPEETLFVGDMPIDVTAARGAGLDVAVIATGPSMKDALRASEPEYFLDQFSQLVDVVMQGTVVAR